MAITWLADVLRDAGLTVVEHSGWKTRAVRGDWSPEYGVVHATAAPRSQSDDTQARIVRDGHATLDGPIANAMVDRTGRWHVLAAGRCNTTIIGTAGPYKGHGNPTALGVEAANDNRSEPWPDVQYNAYVRGWAAVCQRLNWSAGRLRGHKEHTPGHKTDPTFNMTEFRRRVTAAMQEEDMAAKDLLNEDVVPNRPWRADAKTNTHVRWEWAVTETWDLAHDAAVAAAGAAADVKAVRADVAALKARPLVDPVAIGAAIDAALRDPAVLAALATAINEDQARRLAD
jgi:hypothetical protein